MVWSNEDVSYSKSNFKSIDKLLTMSANKLGPSNSNMGNEDLLVKLLIFFSVIKLLYIKFKAGSNPFYIFPLSTKLQMFADFAFRSSDK